MDARQESVRKGILRKSAFFRYRGETEETTLGWPKLGVYFRFGHWKYRGWTVRHESVLSTLFPIILRSGMSCDRTLVFPLSNVIVLHACFVSFVFVPNFNNFLFHKMLFNCNKGPDKVKIQRLRLVSWHSSLQSSTSFFLRKTKLMGLTI